MVPYLNDAAYRTYITNLTFSHPFLGIFVEDDVIGEGFRRASCTGNPLETYRKRQKFKKKIEKDQPINLLTDSVCQSGLSCFI